MLVFIILLPVAVLRETISDRTFWDEPFFRPSTPPEPLIDDLTWVKENYSSDSRIVMVKGGWPEGPHPSFLEWAMYILDIDMVSSFVYVGKLNDLLASNPSKGLIRPNPLPSNAHTIITSPEDYDIFVFTYPEKWINFYDPDPIESFILEELRPTLYRVRNLSSSEILQWCEFYNNMTAGTIPSGDVGYLDSFFTNWTARFGQLTVAEKGAEFVLWQNITEGWIEVRGLEIDYPSYPYILVRLNTMGSLVNYMDFYNSQNDFLGRWKLDSTTSNSTVFISNTKTLNLPTDESIWRIVIVLSSIQDSRTLLMDWITFLNITYPFS